MKQILMLICACFLTLSFAKEQTAKVSLEIQKDIQKKQLIQELIDRKNSESVRNKLELIEKLNAERQPRFDSKFQELYHEKIEYYNENGYPVGNSHGAPASNGLRCDFFTVTMCDPYGDGWN